MQITKNTRLALVALSMVAMTGCGYKKADLDRMEAAAGRAEAAASKAEAAAKGATAAADRASAAADRAEAVFKKSTHK